jgi:hypothetical protein
MCGKYTESQKKATYKYRQKNKDEYNLYMKTINIIRYHEKKDLINSRRKQIYEENKDPFLNICRIFRRILF